MLLIYLQSDSARTHYIMGYFFGELYRSGYRFTGDMQEYTAYDGPKIGYGREKSDGGLWFNSCGLLEEDSIINTTIQFYLQDLIPIAKFPRLQQETDPFDPFAAAFFLLSRYEEWLPWQPDEHGRFRPEDSAQHKAGLSEIPLVNQWAALVVDKIKENYPDIDFSLPAFKATVTIDIDHAYAFKHKGFFRSALILGKSFLFSPRNSGVRPGQVWINKISDPYDTFGYLEDCRKESKLGFLYFFLGGKYSKYDKNIPAKSKAFADLVKSLARENEIGVHPSYYTKENPANLGNEINRLADITGKPVLKSRHHFLRFTIPETYRQLIALGIKEDYSMGYSSLPGFRAGTCSSFFWFDLERNCQTPLRVFPITWMEGSFAEHQGLDAETAWPKMEALLEIVYTWKGHFIPLWHNHSVAEYGSWKGWRINFDRMITAIKERVQ